jgi:hypothetical protein
LFALHSCRPPAAHGHLHPHNVIVDGVELIANRSPESLLLRMSAAGLPKMDFIGHCDAYVTVCVEGADAQAQDVAKTATVTNSAAPQWEAVSIPWQRLPKGKDTLLTLRIFDRDLTDSDDVIGVVRVTVEEALAAGSGNTGYAIVSENGAEQGGKSLGTLFFSSTASSDKKTQLNNASDIQYSSLHRSDSAHDTLPPPSVCITGFCSSRNAHLEPSADHAADCDVFEPTDLLLRMSAAGLPKMDFIGHCDAYVTVCVEGADAQAQDVAKTATVTNSAAPQWEAVSIPWQRLPKGKDTLLTLRIFDRDLTDSDDVIGVVRVTVEEALAAGSGNTGYAIVSENGAEQGGKSLGTLFFSSTAPHANQHSSSNPTEIKSKTTKGPSRGKRVPSISPLFEIADAHTVGSAVAADILSLSIMMQQFADSNSELSKLLQPALSVCNSGPVAPDSASCNLVSLGVIQAIETALGWQQGAEGQDVASLVHYIHEGLDSKGDPSLAGHGSIHTVAALLSEAVRLLTDMARFGPQHHKEAVCNRDSAAAFIRLAGTDVTQHAYPAIFALCELVLHFGGSRTVNVLQSDGLIVLVHTALHFTGELGMKASQSLGRLVQASDECRAAVLKAGAVQALLSSVKNGVDGLLLTAAASLQSRTIGAQVTSSMSALRQLCEFPAFQSHIVADGGVATLVNIFNGIMNSDSLSQSDRCMLLGDAAFVAARLALVSAFRRQLIDAGIIASMMIALSAHKFIPGEWRRWTGEVSI